MSRAAQPGVSAADLRRDYEPLAERFESRWHSFHSATRHWVLTRWPEGQPSDGRLLDVGCGVGGFLCEVAARHPGLCLFGVDIVPALLARARRAVPPAVLLEADAQDPPFAPGSFDVATSLNIAHHLNDPAAHLIALTRLVRPGGTIFLATFAGGRTWGMRLADWWLSRHNPAWRRMLSAAEIEQMVTRQPKLTMAAAEVIRADRWWWLQLYRLDVEP